MKTDTHWKKIGLRPHHGICVPLFSLKSRTGSGIGEFSDLLPLLDWCRLCGFDTLQLLPLNDTGMDPSPFNPISSCALDPIYLSLKELRNTHQKFVPWTDLNALSHVNRREVKNRKYEWLLGYFTKNFPTVAKTAEYQSFLTKNLWLADYAKTDFDRFLQYLSFSQMKAVKQKADALGIFLKGDMPILVSPTSADVSAHPSFFHLDLVAGAPPDYYNALGQKWGFPLYNWDAMRNDHFRWWKQRFSTFEELYHIYRIDHVVGFFRIWGIPIDQEAKEGSFFPPDPSLWEKHGTELLEMMLDLCPLLPIAEDLGTVPEEVFSTLKTLGICGTKLLRWQRESLVSGPFIPYDQYEPFSMTTVSDVDIDPLPLWWQNYPEEAAAFSAFKQWHFEPTLSPEKHLEILSDSHKTSSYFHINPLQEYLLLFPEFSHLHLEEERVNFPGTQLPTNWTYRFRPYLEELLAHVPLKKTIQRILSKNCQKSDV